MTTEVTMQCTRDCAACQDDCQHSGQCAGRVTVSVTTHHGDVDTWHPGQCTLGCVYTQVENYYIDGNAIERVWEAVR